VHPIPNSIHITRAGPVFTQMPGLDEDSDNREHASSGGGGRQDQAFNYHLEDLVGLESAAIPSAYPRVALLGEDAIGSRGMLAWVSKRG